MASPWSRLTVVQLRTALKERGIKQTGNKAELVSKLDLHDREAGGTMAQDGHEPSPGDISARMSSEYEESLTDPISPKGTLPTPIGLGTAASAPQPLPARGGPAGGPALPHVDGPIHLPESPGDSHKRKRRSGSPDPATSEIYQKRARPTVATNTETPDLEAASTLAQLAVTSRSPGFTEAVATPFGDSATSNSLTLGTAVTGPHSDPSAATKTSNSGLLEGTISRATETTELLEHSEMQAEVPKSSTAFNNLSGKGGLATEATEAMRQPFSETQAAVGGATKDPDGLDEHVAFGPSSTIKTEVPMAAFAPESETRNSHMANTDPYPLESKTIAQENKDSQETIIDYPMAGTDPEPLTESRVDVAEQIKTDAEYDEELQVEPSLHRHTTALYIRNFMRPLRPNAVEEYITNQVEHLAPTPNTPPVVAFYLDAVKSHAFVEFCSVEAARMARARLHGIVWPDERNRKALWADFILPEKIPSWMDAEDAAVSGRPRNASKKWEVVYDRVGDSMVATHQEESTMMRPQNTTFSVPGQAPPPEYGRSDPPPPRSISGVNTAPLGPKGFLHPFRRGSVPGTVAQGDRPSFVTPDPNPVTYQPVSKELAERRLQVIQSHKATDVNKLRLGKEKNRYWFEDGDRFVDRGPEMFEGIRPPHRERQHQERQRQRRGGHGGGWEGSYRPQPRGAFGSGGSRAPYNDYRGRNTGRDDDRHYGEARRRNNYGDSSWRDAPRRDDYRSSYSSRGHGSRR